MSVNFDSHKFAQEAIVAGKAHGWRVAQMAAAHDYARPWFHLLSNAEGLPQLYISAGIHGDEPAGAWAALELLNHPEWFEGCEIFLFPLLNPAGMELGVRENADGLDLNRDYRYPQSRETSGHLEVLDGLPLCSAYLHLHEDWEATGAYLYAVHPKNEPGAAPALLAAMSKHLPIEPAEEIDGYAARDGVIRRETIPERDDWPEGFYMAHQHGAYHGYTLETPSSLELNQRVNAHVDATRALVEFVLEHHAELNVR